MENQTVSQNSESPSSVSSSNPAVEGGSGPGWSSEDIRSMQSELKSSKEQIANFSKSAQTLDKIQKVFNPEPENVQDPDDAFLDHYLQQALEAEKNGTPIPLTTNLAVKLYEEKQRNKELQKRMGEIGKKVDAMENPSIVSDRQAFATIDSSLEQRLGEMYGDTGYAPQIFTAAANLIVQEITRLKTDTPEVWDRIKKSPNHQRSMVDHFVGKVIPERAKQSMQREALANYEMSPQELMAAFKEAGEIEDPKTRQKVRENVRQQLLMTMYSDKKKNSLSSKLKEMY